MLWLVRKLFSGRELLEKRRNVKERNLVSKELEALLKKDQGVECPANFVPVRKIRNWHERSLVWHEARGINLSRW
jgi:hypothetical protein